MSAGIVVLIGSGELGPSMKSTYRHLLEHIAATSITIVDSPYGFQENADDLTRRAQEHFRKALGVETKVASLRRPDASPEECERFLAEVEESQVVFAGPGSPSYALRVWPRPRLAAALRTVVDRGGAVVMASAAAVTLGVKSIPVYEIYKVGADPSWLDGIDFLSQYGLKVVVVPHWNNREGGFHDTSRCFVGMTRFRRLVNMLPADVSVLGIDEHTSLTLHAATGTMRVLGAGEAHFNDQSIDGTMSAPNFVARPAVPDQPPPPSPASPWRPLIELLVDLRDEARARGDFHRADVIRAELAKVGVQVRDGPAGTEWHL